MARNRLTARQTTHDEELPERVEAIQPERRGASDAEEVEADQPEELQPEAPDKPEEEEVFHNGELQTGPLLCPTSRR